jgi:hypothetical protein
MAAVSNAAASLNYFRVLNPSTDIVHPQHDAQEWIAKIKKHTQNSDRLTEIVITVAATRWITPITRNFQIQKDTGVWDRTEIVDSQSLFNEFSIDLQEENKIEKYDFEEEAEDLFNFIENVVKPYGASFDISASTLQGRVYSFSQKIIQKGNKTEAEILASLPKE